MTNEVNYKIRFVHKSIYSFIDLTLAEYSEIEESLTFQLFLANIEEAYEKIVYNYRDYEKNNFSIVLNHALNTDSSGSHSSALQSMSNSIDRHISNILTSTYIYTCLFKKNEKNRITNICNLKDKFQKITNLYHTENYHYTFMSALRNKLNHGGNLSKLTTIGKTWSSCWANQERDGNVVRTKKKDKLFSLLDVKVAKEEVRNIIDKVKHYKAIEENIPDVFFLRNSMRIYINLLSCAHSEIREKRTESLNHSNDLILSYLSKNDNSNVACIIEYVNGEEKMKFNLFSYLERIKKAKAPLNLEHYSMPGEFEERPITHK